MEAAIVVGTLYLIIGLVVRVFPNILAGYSSLSNREKENADKNGLRFYASVLFLIMGSVALIGYPISIWLENPGLSVGIVVIVTIAGLVISVIGGGILTNNRI